MILNPGCEEAIEWIQQRERLAEEGRATRDYALNLTHQIGQFLRDSGREFNEPTLASLGSHRYARSQAAVMEAVS